MILGLASTPVLAKNQVLSAGQIRDRLVGQTITDGTHWSYTLNADGRLDAIDMGKVRAGIWRIAAGELCIRVPLKADEDCWTVRQRGEQLLLEKEGVFSVEISVEARPTH